MKKIDYIPSAAWHPFWLKLLYLFIFGGVLYFCCLISFTNFNDVRAYIGIPIGFVGGYYISYYVMYGLYKRFSDISKDDLYRELEKAKEQEDDEEETEMIKKMHQEFLRKESQKDIDKKNNKD